MHGLPLYHRHREVMENQKVIDSFSHNRRHDILGNRAENVRNLFALYTSWYSRQLGNKKFVFHIRLILHTLILMKG